MRYVTSSPLMQEMETIVKHPIFHHAQGNVHCIIKGKYFSITYLLPEISSPEKESFLHTGAPGEVQLTQGTSRQSSHFIGCPLKLPTLKICRIPRCPYE
jgi:hypothetical protein